MNVVGNFLFYFFLRIRGDKAVGDELAARIAKVFLTLMKQRGRGRTGAPGLHGGDGGTA